MCDRFGVTLPPTTAVALIWITTYYEGLTHLIHCCQKNKCPTFSDKVYMGI